MSIQRIPTNITTFITDLFHFRKEWLLVFQTSVLQSIEYQFSISIMKNIFSHNDNIKLVVFPAKISH
jgi:hypothetical protein